MAADELRWADVAAAGGIREWVDAEIARQGLADPGASKLGTLIQHGDWVRYWTEQG